MKYETPTIEFIPFDYEDIITTSGGCVCPGWDHPTHPEHPVHPEHPHGKH